MNGYKEKKIIFSLNDSSKTFIKFWRRTIFFYDLILNN